MLGLKTIIQWILLITGSSVLAGKSFEDSLRKSLLIDYNPLSLPESKTLVSVAFTVVDYNIKEEDQTLDLNIWMKFSWNDHRLTWDAKQYGGISKLAFKPSQVWVPDFYLYNNADHNNFEPFAQTKVLAMNEQGMIWVPPAYIKAMCIMDLTYWPFDSQHCQVKFGSWVHSINEMPIQAQNVSIDFEDPASEESPDLKNVSRRGWDIVEAYTKVLSKKYECCKEKYMSISIFLRVQRNQSSHVWLVGIPCVTLGLLSLMVFLFPPGSPDKIVIATIIFLADLYFLISLSNMIGHAADNPPLILQMMSWQLILVALKVIVSVMVIRMSRPPHSYSLPGFLASMAEKFGPALGLKSYVDAVKREKVDLNSKSGKDQDVCLMVAAFIDRLCFILFAFIFFVFLIRFPIFS